MTQVEMARATGLSQPTISAIERGERDVTTRHLEQICDCLGLQPEAMLRARPGDDPLASLRAEVGEALTHGGARAVIAVLVPHVRNQ